ncbi:MAG: DinB family protein, partial [Candidatus Limnocylindria bacterium]
MSTTTPATSRSDLLARIEHGYVATRAVLEAIPTDRYDERLPSGMTLREVLAHLAAWEETVPPRVQSALAGDGDVGDYNDIDGFNARVSAETRDTSIDDLKTRLARSHAAIVDVVRSFEGRDVPDLAVQIVEWNTTQHYPDHFADLGASIKAAKDLAMAVSAGWINFRLALMSLGAAGLEATTPVGWTYKALAQHTAGWEDLTVKRLARLRESGEFATSGVDTDAFNAEMAERAKERSGPEVLADLDAAHTRLVAEVEKLTPEQIRANDEWAIAVVAGNSYGHYG